MSNTTPPTATAPPIPGLGKVGEAAAVWVHCATLKRWRDNPKKYPSDKINAIAASMKRFGWGSAVVAHSPENPEVSIGHGRLLAAELLGVDVAPVRYVEHLTPAELHALAVADNALSERQVWDQALLEQVMRNELIGAPIDLSVLGFSTARLNKLLAEAPAVKVIHVETSTLRAEFFVSVRGQMPSQPEVLELLRTALAAIEGVHVEIGGVMGGK